MRVRALINEVIAITLACCLSSSALATDLSSEQQRRAYQQCKAPCLPSMEKSAMGQALKDKPFFFEAYCSCYCARMALRLTSDQLVQMGKDAVTTGDLFASSEIRRFATQAAELCLVPFTQP